MGGSFDSDSDFPVSFGQVQLQRPIASTQPATATAPTQLISDSTSSIQKPTASSDSSVPVSSLAVSPTSSLSPVSTSTLPTTNPSGASVTASAAAAAITSDYAPFSIDSDDDEDDDDNGDDQHEEYHSMEFSASSEHEGRGDDKSDTPSNELLLGTAFCTFMSFAVIQSFFAVLAGSKAMMGDSAAMLVDALTYFFNWIAERRKRRFDERSRLSDTLQLSSHHDASEQQQQLQQDPIRARRIRERSKRKMVLQLEIFPPCLSVSTLMIVTGVVMHKSIQILILDMHRDPSEQLRPNVNMMMAFSIFNLALDGLNVFCFARAKHLLGYSTIATTNNKSTATRTASGILDDGMERGSLTLNIEAAGVATSTPASVGNSTGSPRQQDWRLPKPTGSTYRQVSGECSESEGGGDEAIIQEHHAVTASSNTSSPSVAQAGTNGNGMRNPGDSLHNHNNRQHHHHHHDNHFDHEEEDQQETEHANLNMCSAYTHVFADTLRSIAVIVASVIADVVDSVTPEEADAAAAVVVSILVLLSMVPLFHGLVQSVSELRAILREEESEKAFPGHANATTELT